MSHKRPRPVDDASRRSRIATSPIRRDVSALFPYQEIFLRILSFLSPTELATIQGVNKYWAKMSLDPQLWKRLYLTRYPHPHHSRLIYKAAATPTGRALRPIARLPSRAFPPPSPTRSSSGPVTPERPRTPAQGKPNTTSDHGADREEVGWGVRNDGVDWKMMLRLGTNWSNGNALSQTTIPLPPSPSPSNTSLRDVPTGIHDPPRHSEQHIALFPSFIVTSNPTSPLVHVHRSSSSSTSSAPLGIIPPPPGWSSPSRPDNVTAICADHAVSQSEDDDGVLPARLAVFHQSGGFVVVRLRTLNGRLSWSRESIHPAQSRPRRRTTYAPLQGDPVVLAAFHSSVLLTCTTAFHLSVYTIPEATGDTASRPHHLQTMHSDVSVHPATLSLFPLSTEEAGDRAQSVDTHFRAALTYCTPLYPQSWTVAVQEFSIDLNHGTQPLTGDMRRGECWHVGRGDEEAIPLVWPRKVRSVVGVKGTAVGVGTDGRWAVLAGEDNQIQVYSLPTPSPSPPPSYGEEDRTAPIVHSQTLLAHSAAVTSISLSAGRCVSGGKDGRILVWELDEEDEQQEFAPLTGVSSNLNERIAGGRLGRTVGYVEVRPGGRRKWGGAAGPYEDDLDDIERIRSQSAKFAELGLPHPASISSAARSLFLPRPPDLGSVTSGEKRNDGREVIRQLAFDEEKIVGLIQGGNGEVMRVWGFNG